MTAGEFRNGVTFEMDGQVQQVIEFQHVKPGKGAAFVRVKMKNVVTGAVTETSFNPTAKFEEAFVERREMQYLYNDGELYYFMDQETYEQVPLMQEQVEEAMKYLRENGYEVKRVRTVDMFGMSGHVETVALLTKKCLHCN